MEDERIAHCPPFAALRAFDSTGRLGGVRKAARALGIDHAAVSRHLRMLEQWTGVRLIDKSGMEVGLTPDGARYHARVAAAMAELRDATSELMGQQDNHLVVFCPPGWASYWLTDLLHEFHEAHADIDLEFRHRDPAIALRGSAAHCEIRHHIDASLNMDSHMRGLLLGRQEMFPVASPECAANLKIGSAPDFLNAPLLHHERSEHWNNWLKVQGVACETPIETPRLWHAHLTIEAARKGQGIALGNMLLAQDELRDGRLVRIEPASGSWRPVHGHYHFLAPVNKWHSGVVGRFRSWLHQRFMELQKERMQVAAC